MLTTSQRSIDVDTGNNCHRNTCESLESIVDIILMFVSCADELVDSEFYV